jgi:hypothetical protein
MTDNINTGQYSFDEVWYKLDDYYHFHPEFGKLLVKALSFLPCEDVDTVLGNALFSFPILERVGVFRRS